MRRNHKTNVIELSTRPAFAHPDLPKDMATRPATNDKGGANNIRIPARIPKIEPHPKPGSLTICVPTESQGDKASQKLILPITSDFILLYSFRIAIYSPDKAKNTTNHKNMPS